ncbi:MAG TPA: PKD domain-containing protein [Chitinophagaceae bacterium]|nr:PKD domain-containing protein [Chitinophagaceae bacterium]
MKTLHQKSKTCLLITLTLIGIIWGCKKTERLATPPPPAITVTASVAGIVSDLNNAPVSGALVAAGASTTTTDANGQFTLIDIQLYEDAGFVKVTKEGYITGSRTFLVNSNTTNNIKIQLLPKTISGTIASSSGGNVDVTGGAKINFTASSFVNAVSNTAYSGNVAVAGFYLNPADANFRQYMPGDLRGVSTTNKEGILKSFGMLSVEMNDAGGQKLQLAEGKTATITIPIPPAMQATAPATISLWYFDETKGIWKEEGTATKQSTSYVGNVSHFSFWNAGDQGADVQLDATFKNDSTGLALTNKLVTITSVNFGTTNGYTDNNGKISGLVPANEALVLKVSDDCGETIYSRNIGPFSTNTDLGNINVPWRSSCLLIKVVGTVVNCNNVAVTNGYVQITTGNNRFTQAINNGSFTIFYNHSSNPGGDSLKAYDLGSGDSSIPVPLNISGASIDIGQVRACRFPSPVADFTYTVSGSSFPVTVTFTNASTNATGYLWDFGDGGTSNVPNPTHLYSTAGDYTVRLIATGAGIADTAFQIVHLINSPVAGFTYYASGLLVPVTVNFSNTSTIATSWSWDFGDGFTSTVQNPSHTYTTAGDYTVKLKATGPGITDSTFKILHLVNQPGDTYIILTLNGINYSWLPPADSVIVYGERVADTSGSFYTSIRGQAPLVNRGNSISLNIGTGNNTAPGNYSVYIGSRLNDTLYTSSFTNQSPLATNITEYGAVNGYISGTVSGNMALFDGSGSNNPVVYPFTCSYRAKRFQ